MGNTHKKLKNCEVIFIIFRRFCAFFVEKRTHYALLSQLSVDAVRESAVTRTAGVTAALCIVGCHRPATVHVQRCI